MLTSIAVADVPAAENHIEFNNLVDSVTGYVARVELNNPAEVMSALERAEQFYIEHEMSELLPPIVMVLHGPEVEIFNRSNYQRYKPIVDLAARLKSFNVVDVRVCQTRMREMGEREEYLYPFVDTVPFGPAEIQRLVSEENYEYF